MARHPQQILPLTGGKVIAQIQLKRLVVHGVHRLPQKQRAAVGGHVVEAHRIEGGHQLVHVLPAHQLEQILGLRSGGKGFRIQKTVLHIPGDAYISPVEALVQKTAVGDHISGKHHAARLRDPQRLADGLPLVTDIIEVIERPQKQRDIVGAIGKRREIQGISLDDRDVFLQLRVLLEYLDIVFHQLHRIHRIALPRQRVGVAPASRADLQHAVAGFYVLLYVPHGGQKFHRPMPRRQPAVLVVAVVKFNQILVRLHSKSPPSSLRHK